MRLVVLLCGAPYRVLNGGRQLKINSYRVPELLAWAAKRMLSAVTAAEQRHERC